MPKSANLRNEIKTVVVNQSDAYIEFRNGSIMKVATANDNSRFMRANILINKIVWLYRNIQLKPSKIGES